MIEQILTWAIPIGFVVFLVALGIIGLKTKYGIPHIPKDWVPPMPPVKPPREDRQEGFRTFEREWRDID